MDTPDQDRDEPVILDSRNVTVNSISYHATLTTRRIHLTASKQNVIPSSTLEL